MKNKVTNSTFFLKLMLIILLGNTNGVQAAQVEVNAGRGLVAYIEQNQSCDNPYPLRIVGEELKYFQGNRQRVNSFAKKTVANTLLSKCPELKRIAVTGLVKDKPVFEGFMQAENRWQLVDAKEAEFENNRAEEKQRRRELKAEKMVVRKEQIAQLETQRLEAYLAAPDAEFSGDPWRFELKCGGKVFDGFLFTDLAMGGEVRLSGYNRKAETSRGALIMESVVNPNTKTLSLTSKQYTEDKFANNIPIFNVEARLDDNKAYLKGVSFSGGCNALQAWKTTFDRTEEPSGLVPGLAPKGLVELAQCRPFFEWYAANQQLVTPSGRVSSLVVDSSYTRKMLGISYDELTPEYQQKIRRLAQQCVGLMRDSATTEDAQRYQAFQKVYSGSTQAGPYVFQSSVHNHSWFRHMVYATAIRDARELIPAMITQARALAPTLDGLRSVKASIDEAKSTEGIFAVLPQQDRLNYLQEVEGIETKLASALAKDRLDSVPWADFKATKAGIMALNATEKQLLGPLQSTMPQAGIHLIVTKFSHRRGELSKQLVNRLTNEYQLKDKSLKGMRAYSKLLRQSKIDYEPALEAWDYERLNRFMAREFHSPAANNNAFWSNLLAKEIPSGERGLAQLDAAVADLLHHSSVTELRDSQKDLTQDQQLIASAFITKQIAIKQKNCMLPKGFEEMGRWICN